jgi:hypothetical protein
MSDSHERRGERRDAELALVPVPKHAPARFESYPLELMERAFELWSTIAGRSGARVVRLLSGEYEAGTALPTASTVNRWALDGSWTAKADADLARSHGRTLYELQLGWLAGLRLAQQTLLNAMVGELDHLPMSGAARIKAAEIVLRTIERGGLLAILPQAEAQESTIDWNSLSLEEREAYMRDQLQRRKGKS